MSKGLVAEVPNKIYIQVVSKPKDLSAKIEHIEFDKAFLMEGSNTIIPEVKHIHNGRALLEFTPKADTLYMLNMQRGLKDKVRQFPLPSTMALEGIVTLNKGVFSSND